MVKHLGEMEMPRELVFRTLSATVQAMTEYTEAEHAKDLIEVLKVCKRVEEIGRL